MSLTRSCCSNWAPMTSSQSLSVLESCWHESVLPCATPLASAEAQIVSFDDITADFKKMEVKRDGKPVVLTAQEFKTFQFLVQNAERVISRDELLNRGMGISKLSFHANRRQSHPETSPETGERPLEPGPFPHGTRNGV